MNFFGKSVFDNLILDIRIHKPIRSLSLLVLYDKFNDLS